MFDVRPCPGNIEHRTPNIQHRTNLLYCRRVLVFQVAQSGDALLPFLDERIELGNLDGVLALFLFAETEQVSPVRRTPTVEEEFVLFADGGAQRVVTGNILAQLAGANSKLNRDFAGSAEVAEFAQMNAVLVQPGSRVGGSSQIDK